MLLRHNNNFALFVMALAVCAAGAIGLSTLFLSAGSIPSYQEVRSRYTRSEALLLDRHDVVVHELRLDKRGRRLDWVSIDKISPALKSAVINAEDKRFLQHNGVDWASIFSALWGSIRSANPRGASTISMQLASNLDENLQPRTARRSLLQKLNQIRHAYGLERRWSKEQILEAYLNLISFRGELQGIQAASQGLFGKTAQGLNDTESVILAALIRSPNASIDRVSSRACMLAETVKLQANNNEIVTRTAEALSHPYFVAKQASLAPQVAQRLLGSAKSGATSLKCTLDGTLQSFASDALVHHILTTRTQNVHDGALLVADIKSGDVLAYVGNTGDYASARYVDGTQAMRQAGSTLKPFVYGLAFETRLLTPASLIDDSPLDIPASGGVYRPKNYDDKFHGLVTARVALGSSLNVPAVKTLKLVTVDSVVEKLRQLGFRDIRDPDYYGLSLALGSVDVTLWDLVNAYRTIANGGIWSPMRLIFEEGEPSARKIFSREVSYLLSNILSDRESRSLTFGLESPLSTRYWAAAKTGTSKDMRDNWCVGFSENYIVGVWVGNFSGEPMWNVSGMTGAAPVWVAIMDWLHRNQPSRAPEPPQGIVSSVVENVSSGTVRREWFLKGTETAHVSEAAAQANFRIVYPPPATVIALDPDIPVEDQRVLFEATPSGVALQWVLDGQLLGSADSPFLWFPTSGRHTLILADSAQRIYDSSAFEVRGSLPP
jgi:penicillin-binding protein 1C